MSPEEQASYEALQAEKQALGIVDEPKVETEVETTTEEETKTIDTDTDKDSDVDEDVKDRKHIPVSEYKNLKKELQADFAKKELEYQAKIEALSKEASKAKPDAQEVFDLEKEAKELAEELDFDPEKTKILLDRARKGLNLSDEDRQALADLKQYREDLAKLREDKEELEQQKIFNSEWSDALKDIKAQYPNASEEQIAKAKEQIYEMSRSEKYHDKDLDYLIFKEKEVLSKTLFSPKQKTFERGTNFRQDAEDFDLSLPANFDSMTPAQRDSFLAKREAFVASMPKDKFKITETDDKGNLVERWDG